MTGFEEKYSATRFDENDANDAVADRARQAVLNAYCEVISDEDELAPRQLEFIMAGLMVGVAQVLRGCAQPGDQSDAAIRASMIQTAPWAVDHARAQQGQPPLTDA